MKPKDKALRIAFTAFRSLSEGNQFSQSELKLLSDLCATALPEKLRFTQKELDEIKRDSEALRGLNVLAGINAR